jgi:hypothetical protein
MCASMRCTFTGGGMGTCAPSLVGNQCIGH